MDTLTPAQQSVRMTLVPGRDTGPVLAVRKALHARGYCHRLHVSRLPRKPGIVFPRRHNVDFVHGCYWHMHEG